MDSKILVSYASKYGATAEIAENITELFTQAGLQTDVMPVKQVQNLADYQTVVLGSALYIGRWRKDALKFIKKNQSALAKRDVWIFLSGPTGNEADNTKDAWHMSQRLEEALEPIAPHDIKVFRGVLDIDKLSNLDKWIIKRVKAPVGDFRDWDNIQAWANGIVQTAKASQMQAV